MQGLVCISPVPCQGCISYKIVMLSIEGHTPPHICLQMIPSSLQPAQHHLHNKCIITILNLSKLEFVFYFSSLFCHFTGKLYWSQEVDDLFLHSLFYKNWPTGADRLGVCCTGSGPAVTNLNHLINQSDLNINRK